jgi:hypothetical protein
MNDHDPENSRAIDRKTKTSQATIAMPNGSHQQLGQHPRCNFLPHAVAPLCAKPSVDIGARLIDGVFLLLFSNFYFPFSIFAFCPLGSVYNSDRF